MPGASNARPISKQIEHLKFAIAWLEIAAEAVDKADAHAALSNDDADLRYADAKRAFQENLAKYQAASASVRQAIDARAFDMKIARIILERLEQERHGTTG